jgi:ribosomal protein S18 acetylase RimI-like enzyme
MDWRWSVRHAGRADVDALALVGAATFLETFAGMVDGQAILTHCRCAHDPATYASYLDGGARLFLAELEPGGAPIGYAVLMQPDLPGAAADDIELKRIYTLSRFHGRGIGAALMEAVVAAAAGHRRLLLGVYKDNARALAFYAKCGFDTVGRRDFDVGGHSYDDLVLARPLCSPTSAPVKP